MISQPASPPLDLLLGDRSFTLRDGMLYDADAEPVALRAKSLLFLKTLLQENGSIVSKSRLAEAVWPGLAVTDESISQCVADVRRLLQDGSHEILETFPKRGYRINARIVTTTPPARRRRGPVFLAAGAAILIGIAVFWWTRQNPEPQAPPLREAVAILSFRQDENQGTEDYVAPGLAGDLAIRLAELSGVQVVPTSLSFAHRGDGEPVAAARALDARYVVHGSVRYVDDKVRISLELIDAQSGTIGWAARYDEGRDRLVAIRDKMVTEIASAILHGLRPPDRQRIETTGTRFPSAYRALLQGRRALGQFSMAQSLVAERHLRAAIRIDPDYARAYAELAALYAIRFENGWTVLSVADEQKAMFFANRALEIDPDLWLAHYASGRLHSVMGTKDFDKAETHLERAMSLQPANDDARVYYGAVKVILGRAKEAIPIIEAVLETHPDPPFWYFFTYGHALFQTGRHAEAATALDRCLNQMPTSPYCLRFQIVNYAEMGRIEDAEWSLQEYGVLGFDTSIRSIMGLIQDQSPDHRRILESALRKAGSE